MSKVEDNAAEAVLIDSEKQTLFHLERYLSQRRDRIENRKENYEDHFIRLMCDFIVSQDAEMDDLDVGTRKIIADNQKIQADIRLLNRGLYALGKQMAPKKEKTPRKEQLAKARVQAVARYIWGMHPNMSQPEMAEHKAIFNLEITGAKGYTPETIRKWVAEVDPRAPEKKRGRPPKAKK